MLNTDYGIVIKPDFVWYTILSEISYLVNESPDIFRKFFTYQKEGKIVLAASNSSLIDMPAHQLLDMVLELLPADIQRQDIIPNFTTSDDDSRLAFALSFLETVSSYYEYTWYGCNYNKIKILGEISDYKLMLDSLDRFNRITPLQNYITQAKNAVQDIITHWNDDMFWKTILWTEVGYGGDIVDGWFKNLFNKCSHWHEHLCVVEATETSQNNVFLTVTGILSSRIENGYLVPNFERMVLLKNEIDPDTREPKWDEFIKYESLFTKSMVDLYNPSKSDKDFYKDNKKEQANKFFEKKKNKKSSNLKVQKTSKKITNIKKTIRKH